MLKGLYEGHCDLVLKRITLSQEIQYGESVLSIVRAVVEANPHSQLQKPILLQGVFREGRRIRITGTEGMLRS